ncbi:MAG: ribonuclease H-like domain-containing protein, partial [Treponema sp.]|nr:ribonuclease H-like domain-containing protein [Treponema sp.]
MGDLRSRLRRIREAEKSGAPSPPPLPAVEESASLPPGFGGEWKSAGFLTLKRTVRVDAAFALPAAFPEALVLLVPDLSRYGRIPLAADLLFFDLETTGLSSGAGTVAFLAAFGRFTAGGPGGGGPGAGASEGGGSKPWGGLLITQYLLLDYPGEPDFLKAVTGEFDPPPGGRAPLAVSFNGKSFDAQILKTRFRMQGLAPPAYYHADLLHPARRLWK